MSRRGRPRPRRGSRGTPASDSRDGLSIATKLTRSAPRGPRLEQLVEREEARARCSSRARAGRRGRCTAGRRSRSARWFRAAAAASLAPTSRERRRVGTEGRGERAGALATVPRSWTQSRNAWTQWSVWNPAGAAVSDAKISSVDRVGQHRELARGAERRVGEVRDREVGPQRGELARPRAAAGGPGRARRRPRRAGLGDGLGERPVDGRGRRPRPRAARRRRPARGRSRTGRGSRTRGSGSRSRRSGGGASRGRGPAARPRGPAPTPRRPRPRRGRRRRSRRRSTWRRRGPRSSGRERAHDAAGAPPGGERAVVGALEAHRTAVRDDDHGVSPTAT